MSSFPVSSLHPHLLKDVIAKMELKEFTKLHLSCKKMNSIICNQKRPLKKVSAKEGHLIYHKNKLYLKSVLLKTVDHLGRATTVGRLPFNKEIKHVSFEHIVIAGDMAPGDFRTLVLPELQSTGRSCKELGIMGKMERDELVDCLRIVNPWELYIQDYFYDPMDSVFNVVPALTIKVHVHTSERYQEPGAVASLLKVRQELFLSKVNCIDTSTVNTFLKDWQSGEDIGKAKKLIFAVPHERFVREVSQELATTILEGIVNIEDEEEAAAEEIFPAIRIMRDVSPQLARISFQSHRVTIEFHV